MDEKARFEWDRQRPKIDLMTQDSRTAGLISEMVDVNPCVESLEDYEALVEVVVRFLEMNAREIEIQVNEEELERMEEYEEEERNQKLKQKAEQHADEMLRSKLMDEKVLLKQKNNDENGKSRAR